MIIGLTGKIGAGKTTLASALVERGFIEYSFADPLKQIGLIFGFSESQLYGTQENRLEIHPHWNINARTFLQRFGTEILRNQLQNAIPEMNIQYNIIIDLFLVFYNANKHRNIVVSDVRFLNEAQAIRSLDGIIVKVQRISLGGKEDSHTSEQEIDLIQTDYIIDNNVLSKEKAKERIIEIANLNEKKRE